MNSFFPGDRSKWNMSTIVSDKGSGSESIMSERTRASKSDTRKKGTCAENFRIVREFACIPRHVPSTFFTTNVILNRKSHDPGNRLGVLLSLNDAGATLPALVDIRRSNGFPNSR